MRKAIGIIVVVIVAGVLIWFGITSLRGGGKAGGTASSGGYGTAGQGGSQPFVPTRKDAVTVHGYAGGEKVGFLADPEVQKYIQDKYGLLIDAHKAGSTEMVDLDLKQQDFIWPSSSIAAELYEKKYGKPRREEQIFSSPLVLYSWDEVVAGLAPQGLVKQDPGGWYTCDLAALVDKLDAGTKWADLGLPQLYGKLNITTTDPNKSNSGALFCGLLSDVYNNGEPPTDAALPQVAPKLKTFFGRLGFMQSSSGDLFEQYIKTGLGGAPLIVLYENQLVEYGLEHPDQADMIKQKVRIIYPQPTVWAVHPLIALSDNGSKLADALKDPEVQKLAWERHGFRTGLAGVTNDPKVLKVAGIPEQITAVVPLPSSSVMSRLLEAAGGN
jgi:hypothetical protein